MGRLRSRAPPKAYPELLMKHGLISIFAYSALTKVAA